MLPLAISAKLHWPINLICSKNYGNFTDIQNTPISGR